MKYIKDPLIDMPFYLGMTIGRKEYAKKLKSLGRPKSERNFVCSTWSMITSEFEAKSGHPIVLVSVFDVKNISKIRLYSHIIHESVHVWQKIKRYICEDNPSIEFEAYSIQNISMSLMKEYNKRTKGK